VLDGSLTPKGKGRFGGRIQHAIANCSPMRIQTRSCVDLPERFRLLPNYFGLCYNSALSMTTRCRYYAICRPLRARYLHTVRRAVSLIVIFWLSSLVLLLPQLFIQRLEPLLIVDVDRSASMTFKDSLRRPSASVRLVHVCVEFFADWRWNVVYTLGFYVVLCIVPVKSHL